MNENKAVLILSGGLDSTTLLYDLLNNGFDVYPLSFIYGQKHLKEVTSAINICKELKLLHEIINIPFLEGVGSSLTDPSIPIPEGHYESSSMESTVVPNRNMIMLSMALSYAISIDAPSIFYGAHSGDHAIYPDCRPPFINAMKMAAKECDYKPRSIEAPYQRLTKVQIVKRGTLLNVPYASTWTCYNGRDKACGKCGSCIERLEAFKTNNIIDPIQYEE